LQGAHAGVQTVVMNGNSNTRVIW